MVDVAEILIRARNLTQEAFGQAEKDLNGLGAQVKATALGFLSAKAVWEGASAAFRTLSEFVSGSIDSFANAEAAQKKLTTALVQQGHATPAVIGRFNELATTFQNTTSYSDDLVNEMEALLVQVGNVAPDQMGKALTAATDLAAGLGIDLQTATMLVGKAFAGETGTLSRYGIVIDETKVKTQGASAVLDAIQEKFGGQAQAELDTYAGKVKHLANAWDNVKESIGGAVAGDPVVLALLRGLSEAADGTAEGSTTARIALAGMFAAMPQWVQNLKEFHDDLKDAAEAENTLADAARLGATVVTPKQFDATRYALKPLTDGLDVAKKAWEQELEAEKKAKAAADEHARVIQGLTDKLSGAGAIKAANDMREALRQTIPVQKMTRDAQDDINKTMDVAIEVYRAQGRVAPQAMRDLWMETQKAIPVVDGLGDAFEKVGDQVKVEIPEIKDWAIAVKDGLDSMPGFKVDVEMPKVPKLAFKDLFGVHFGEQMSSAIQGALQGGGNPAAAAAGVVGAETGKHIADSLTKQGGPLFKSALGDIFAGTLPMVGSLIGPLAGALWNKLFGHAGRDAVKQFADSMGGFDDLHTKLGALGAQGEQLWIKLTQGVGKNNPEQAKKVIGEINDALAHIPPTMAEVAAQAGFQTTASLTQAANDAVKLWEFMRDSGSYTADQVQQAWEKAQDALRNSGDASQATLQKSYDAAKEGLKALDDEIASLQKSIDSEAPEAVMGVVEAQARARLAALQKERDAAAKHVEEIQSQLQQSMDRVAKALENLPHELDVHVRTHFDGDPGEPPRHAAGAYIRQDHVAQVHGGEIIGPIDFMTRALVGAFQSISPSGTGAPMLAAAGAGGGLGDMAIHVYIGNEKLDARTVKVAKRAAVTGQLKPRAAAGRSY